MCYYIWMGEKKTKMRPMTWSKCMSCEVWWEIGVRHQNICVRRSTENKIMNWADELNREKDEQKIWCKTYLNHNKHSSVWYVSIHLVNIFFSFCWLSDWNVRYMHGLLCVLRFPYSRVQCVWFIIWNAACMQMRHKFIWIGWMLCRGLGCAMGGISDISDELNRDLRNIPRDRSFDIILIDTINDILVHQCQHAQTILILSKMTHSNICGWKKAFPAKNDFFMLETPKKIACCKKNRMFRYIS